MEVVQTAIVHFWPVFVLVLLRPVLGMLTATSFAAVRASVDRAIPHDLPLATGEWLKAQLRERGLQREVAVLTSSSDHATVDAYFPGSSFIQLSPETWLRNDPVGWATGAHELGHALNYRRSAPMHAMLVCARWGTRAAWTLATAFILGNLVYGSVAVAQVTYGLLIVSAVLNALVLWDEAWASHVGMKMLREQRGMDTRRLDGAYLTMGAAFLSYASGMLGTLAVVIGYPHVAHISVQNGVFTPGPPLDAFTLAFIAGISAALFLRAMVELWRFLRPPRYSSAPEAEIALAVRSWLDVAWTVPLVFLLLVVWNQPFGSVFAIAVILASLPALQLASRLLAPALPLVMLPVFLLLMPIVAMLVPSSDERGEPDTMPGDDLLDTIRHEMEHGHNELRQAQLRLVNEPPMYMRVGGLVRVGYVPLLLLFWYMT